MVSYTDFSVEFNKLIKEFGSTVRFRYFSLSGASSGYDDALTYTQSGNDVWCSGILNPLNTSPTSDDRVLIQQGLLLQNDSKIYVNGSIDTETYFKVGVGSPVTREYAFIEQGTRNYDIANTTFYKIAYVRVLPNGSFYGA